MATCNVKKIIITCSAVIGHLFDTIIVASTERVLVLIRQS